jgi:circadian clock protein KaiC
LSSRGFDLREVYVGKDRVLTGTARVMQESQEQAEAELRRRNHERDVRRLAARQKAIESRIMSLTAQAEAEAAELDFAHAREAFNLMVRDQDAGKMKEARGGQSKKDNGKGPQK